MSKTKKSINIAPARAIKIDKALILNRIKSHYNFKFKAELARFLGIETNTLSNWYTRNIINFDLLVTKCEDLNLNWLINGLGNPTKSYINLEENGPSITHDGDDEYKQSDQLKEEIDRLNNTISIQEKTIAAQAKTIAIMELLLAEKNNPV
jgi:hypothetical protein